MKTLKKHGNPPYTVAVLHGGPGASGGMGTVARELAAFTGVLEPIQTKDTVAGQVEELQEVLSFNADIPTCIIGHSWGAWLGFIFAAIHPQLVQKLIMVGTGAFESKYAIGMDATRLERLDDQEQKIALDLIDQISDSRTGHTKAPMARLGELLGKADTYDPLPDEDKNEGFSQHIFDRVWAEADGLRKSGELLEMAARICCPVLAVHGDYDPHPSEGVRLPLTLAVADFRFILLEKCGHTPWRERHARGQFYDILQEEIV